MARKTVGTRAWLDLQADEVVPEVLESHRPGRVVWSSLWAERPDDRLELTLASDGADTRLSFRVLTHAEPPDDELRHRILYRINELLYRDLRHSYGQ